LALAMTGNAMAWEQKTNSLGEPLSWEAREIHLVLDPTGPHGLDGESVEEALLCSLDAWNEELGPERQLIYDGVVERGRVDYEDGQNTIFFDQTWDQGLDSSLLALSWVWSVEHGEISAFDVVLNADHHRWTADGERGLHDLSNTITHELGHVLGLAHSDVEQATMEQSTWPGETEKRDLSADDIAGIKALYPGDHPLLACASAGGSSALPGLMAGVSILLKRTRRRPTSTM
jgi:hypothetical protein